MYGNNKTSSNKLKINQTTKLRFYTHYVFISTNTLYTKHNTLDKKKYFLLPRNQIK